LIEAAGKRRRHPFRDRVLVRLVYRQGLRASEAVGLRWSQLDLDAGTLHVLRLKGSIDSTHSLDGDELRDLRKLRQEVSGRYVLETERGGPLSFVGQGIAGRMPQHVRMRLDIQPGELACLPDDVLQGVEGTDTRLIQAFIGHADIRHTAHYTALSPKPVETLAIVGQASAPVPYAPGARIPPRLSPAR
jgi:integrase